MPTKIEWTEETWNPITGCTPISGGCRNCYAKRMAHRLAGRFGYPETPNEFKVTIHTDRLSEPFRWKKPRKVFVCSMGDLFHKDVEEEFIYRIVDVMIDTPQHTYQILTKRPERMCYIVNQYDKHVGDFPDHIWLGITAENQAAADERIPWLLKTPAAVRFVSVEPMLGPVDIEILDGAIYDSGIPVPWQKLEEGQGIDWVICGGETGPGAREMKAEWAMSLYEQCSDAGVPFFFKKPGDAFRGDIHDLPMENGEFVRQWPKEVIHASV